VSLFRRRRDRWYTPPDPGGDGDAFGRTLENCPCLRFAARGGRLRDDFAAMPPCPQHCRAPGTRIVTTPPGYDPRPERAWNSPGRQPGGSWIGRHRGEPSWRRNGPSGRHARVQSWTDENGDWHVGLADPDEDEEPI